MGSNDELEVLFRWYLKSFVGPNFGYYLIKTGMPGSL